MTELWSQLYEGTLAAALGRSRGAARHGVYVAPPWVRVDAVDPESLEPVAPGEIGVARIVDLANVDSAVAIQTADRVRVTAEAASSCSAASPARRRAAAPSPSTRCSGGA